MAKSENFAESGKSCHLIPCWPHSVERLGKWCSNSCCNANDLWGLWAFLHPSVGQTVSWVPIYRNVVLGMRVALWCALQTRRLGKVFFHSTHEQTKAPRHLATSHSDIRHDRWNWHQTQTLWFSNRTSFPSPRIALHAEFCRLSIIPASQNKWRQLLLRNKS